MYSKLQEGKRISSSLKSVRINIAKVATCVVASAAGFDYYLFKNINLVLVSFCKTFCCNQSHVRFLMYKALPGVFVFVKVFFPCTEYPYT